MDKVVNSELDKAKKFVAVQKKEISKIQKTIEGFIAKSKKRATGKATAKKATAKKATAKKTTKKSTTKA